MKTLIVAALLQLSLGIQDIAHSTATLAVPRRDLGAAVSGNSLVVAGGCTGGFNIYTCDQPTDEIEIFAADHGTLTSAGRNKLSAARGWPDVCALGSTVAFVGGGAGGSTPHSRSLDLLDMSTGKMTTNTSALSAGRWGTACVATDAAIYFAGGKVESSTGEGSMTDEVVVFDPQQQPLGLSFVGKLSEARECTGIARLGTSKLIFAGGFKWAGGKEATGTVDTVDLAKGQMYTWSLPRKPATNDYWIGAASWSGDNGDLIYLADAEVMYVVDDAAFRGTKSPTQISLPTQAASGGIPKARMAQNGVKICGPDRCAVCFYSASPSSVACYVPSTKKWVVEACSAEHIAGAMVASGDTVYVVGGQNSQGGAVATIDIFYFGGSIISV